MTQISIVGLGSGDENQLTLGVWRKLQQASKLYLRTKEHPVAAFLRQEDIQYQSFDAVYEEKDQFEETYAAIVTALLDEASKGDDVVYAVPGHPMVAEQTTQLLLKQAAEHGVTIQLIGGESFLDQAFLRFGFDPVEGFQLLDGHALQQDMLNPRVHTLITQVYDVYSASEVKLTLMELYPDDYDIVVGHALGVAGMERIERVPLYELDRLAQYGNLTVVWLPRSEEARVLHRTFARLHQIVQVLRSPEGCPWDREQTHASLRRYLLEETYEVLETIDADDPDELCEELGDLLLQVMLHAQIEEEQGTFSVTDVIQSINDKLIRRHPHVFGNLNADQADEALARWEEIKQEEKRQKGIDEASISVLDGIPRELPGLLKALKLQKKAAQVGFDWDNIEAVWAKVDEEWAEWREALAHNPASAESEEELGDLLFSIVNAARFMKIDPEQAISATNRKFMQRFSYIEEKLRLQGKTFDQTNLKEMDHYWDEAKKL